MAFSTLSRTTSGDTKLDAGIITVIACKPIEAKSVKSLGTSISSL